MSEQKETFDQRWDREQAEHTAAIETFRAQLAAIDIDGPIDLRGGAGVFSLLAGGAQSVGVCLKCGALILLGDMMERDGGGPIERGVFIHTRWHAESAPQPEG